MSESEEEKEQYAKNREIIEVLRESLRAAASRLTHDVEPAVVFAPAAIPESTE